MNKVDRSIRFLIFSYVFFYLGDFFFQLSYAKEISCLILLIFLFLALPSIRILNRNVCLSFFFCGLAAFCLTDAPPEKIFLSLGVNGGLVALYAFIPIMSMPFFYDDYQLELSNIAKRYTTSALPFLLFIQFSSYILALVIYMGCFVILYELFIKKAGEYNCQRLFRMALLQGYAAAGFWGPSWASSSIIPARLNINWLEIVPVGIAFSFLTLAVTSSLLWFAVAKNRERYPICLPDKNINVNWHKVRTLFTLTASLVTGIFLLNYTTHWSMYVIVPLASFPFALATALVQHKFGKFKTGTIAYYKERVSNGKAEFSLFIVGGFLGAAIEYSGVGMLVVEFLPDIFFHYPVLVAFALISAIVSLAVIGVHPVVSAPSLALALTAEHIGLNNISFAMLLFSSWVLGISVSPFSAGPLIMAGFEQKSSWETGPRTNWKFAFAGTLLLSVAVGVLYNLTSP